MRNRCGETTSWLDLPWLSLALCCWSLAAAEISVHNDPMTTGMIQRFRNVPPAAWIFLAIFGWLVAQLIGLTVWAWVTYPRQSDLTFLGTVDGMQKLEALIEMRRQWQDTIVVKIKQKGEKFHEKLTMGESISGS